MTPEENNQIARHFFDSAWNRGDMKVVDELTSPNVVDHSTVPGQNHGPEKFKEIIGMFRGAMPDVKLTIEDEIYTGDKVVHRWSIRGTSTNPLMGIPPTGKPITLTGITIVRFENGLIVERWANLDELGLLQQLGVVPPPPGQ